MHSEREKMLACELYNALDPELVTAAVIAAGNPCRAIRSIA
jgi:hypothetical protein